SVKDGQRIAASLACVIHSNDRLIEGEPFVHRLEQETEECLVAETRRIVGAVPLAPPLWPVSYKGLRVKLEPLCPPTLEELDLLQRRTLEWSFQRLSGERRPICLRLIIGQEDRPVVQSRQPKCQTSTVHDRIETDAAAAVL